MTPQEVLEIGREAMQVTMYLAAPLLLTALIVGLVIGMIQAATQIQEMTLSFIPKLIGMAIALIVSGTWMLHLIMNFTIRLFENIPAMVVG
ncbi:MAG: flagellar biosynthesis protein FliQ [Gammaproteobacteria bacterium]|nr:flagellar biosynthesis protein FliQ [Gammaproteobacteria bacterium]